MARFATASVSSRHLTVKWSRASLVHLEKQIRGFQNQVQKSAAMVGLSCVPPPRLSQGDHVPE
jgi:hypothetical protein